MVKARRKQRSARKPLRKKAMCARRKKTAEEDAFTRSLLAHGQAAKIPAGGKLPPGATHELVEDEEGEVRPVRRRFSLL